VQQKTLEYLVSLINQLIKEKELISLSEELED